MRSVRRQMPLVTLIGLGALVWGCDVDEADGAAGVDADGVYSLEPAGANDPPAETPDGDELRVEDGSTPTGDGVDASAGEPVSDATGAAPTAGSDSARAGPEVGEARPLADDSDELATFQREVVPLPVGFEGSVFVPPTDDSVTVANRSTDRLSYDDAVGFMRDALTEAGWHLTGERVTGRDSVSLEAGRGSETVRVLVELAASRAGERDVVAITVEHTV